MYHYVRPNSGQMPFFRYLSLDNFRRQLDHFQTHYGYVAKDDFLSSLQSGVIRSSGVVLTFDDGFADHSDHVLPELQRRGLWGIFYVPTGQYTYKRLLDVHRIHVLLGCFGGTEVLAAVRKFVCEDMVAKDDVAAFRNITYLRQTNDEATAVVKRMFNYYILKEYRRRVLDEVMVQFFGDDEAAICASYYLSLAQLRTLQGAGMIVGAHSVTHPVLSRLGEAAQREEIANSFDFLERITGGLTCRTFCYPYGGFHSFTTTTEQILDDVGCRFAFNVEQRDINADDLLKRPQALPRHDCCQYPFGEANLGDDFTGH